jgi:hypothetical protein
VLPNSTVTYDHGVFSANDSANATITVEAQQPAGPGDVNGNGQAAQDLNNDGQFEDVNGDGTLDLLDVQALFANRGVSDSSLDFNGDNNGTVDLLDVQALFSNLP